MPPTPPSCSSSDSECGGQSPPRTPPLYETLTPQFANPRKGTARILVSSRNPINTPLISSQPVRSVDLFLCNLCSFSVFRFLSVIRKKYFVVHTTESFYIASSYAFYKVYVFESGTAYGNIATIMVCIYNTLN